MPWRRLVANHVLRADRRNQLYRTGLYLPWGVNTGFKVCSSVHGHVCQVVGADLCEEGNCKLPTPEWENHARFDGGSGKLLIRRLCKAMVAGRGGIGPTARLSLSIF